MVRTTLRGRSFFTLDDVSRADAWRAVNHFRRQFRRTVGRAYRVTTTDEFELRLARGLIANQWGSVTAVCRRADRFFRVSWGESGAHRDGSFAVFVNWFEELSSVAKAERVLAALVHENDRWAASDAREWNGGAI